MKNSLLNPSRLIVGLLLMTIAVLMFLFARENYSTAGLIAIGLLDLTSVAISRRKGN